MKKLRQLFRVAAATAFVGLTCSAANAATFTAVASGNFSNAATWGGTAPSANVTSDVVIIPSGITVTLDQMQEFDGATASLVVNGTLNSTANSALIMSNGSLNGTGAIMMDSLVLGLASGLGYTGTIATENMTSTGAMIATAANISVNDKLELKNGILSLNLGTLNLNNNATIVVSGGTIVVSGGSLGLTNDYNVVYTTGSANAGLELGGSGLKDVTVDVGAGNSITLMSDLDMDGMLTLSSGELVIDGVELSFSGNGDVNTMGSGMISSTAGTSDITINSTNGLNGMLHFSSGAQVDDLTINTGNANATVGIATDLMVNGLLDLQSGVLELNGNELTVMGGATLSGGSNNSYVNTGNGGSLTLELGAGAGSDITYHIGTNGHYAPVMLINNGSAAVMLGMGVTDDVYANVTTGADLTTDQPMVDVTWHMMNDAAANIDVDMEVMWDAAMEVNGFDRNTIYIAQNVSGTWDTQPTASATSPNPGMYGTTRTNVTSDGAFAVVDEDAVTTSVNAIAANETFVVYPNPVVNEFTFKGAKQPLTVNIYDMAGHLVKSVNASNSNSVSVAELASGVYQVHFTGEDFKAVQKFVKQ